MTTVTRTGNLDDDLFSVSGYVCTGDKYQDPKPILRIPKDKEAWKKVGDLPFKPPGLIDDQILAPYEHLTDLVVQKKKFKDEDGNVITAPPNFVTNPARSGDPNCTTGILFQKDHYEHMPDPYDAGKKIKLKELRYHQSKLQDGKGWNSMHHGNENFNNIEDTYGTELKFKDKKKPREAVSQVDHDTVFHPSNPCKKGNTGNETISAFPEFVPEKNF
jgi:hypothetical protein